MAAPLSPHPHLIRRLLAVLALVVACWPAAFAPASAQTVPSIALKPATAAPAAPKPPSATDIQNLIQTLDDAAARDKLKQQLQLLLQAQQAGTSHHAAEPAVQGLGAHMLAAISHHVEQISNALVNLVEVIADMPQRVQQAAVLLADPVQRSYWISVFIDLIGVLATAFIAAWAARRVLQGPRRAVLARHSDRWLVRLLYLPVIFVVEAAPILALALAAYIALPLFDPSEDARLITSAIISAQIATMLAASITASLLVPSAPGLRLFRLTDETAAYLQVWVRRLAVVAFYGYAVTELAALIGVEDALHEVLSRVWGLILAGMTIIFILQNRVPVARWIAGGPVDEDPAVAVLGDDEPVATPLPEPETVAANGRALRFKAFRRQAAKLWHILAILYVIASYAIWSLQIEGGVEFLIRATFLTAILALVIRLADTFLRQVFDRSFALPGEVKRLLPGLEARANLYLPIFRQGLLVVLYLAGLFALLQIWGLDMIDWLSDGAGRPVMAAVFKIVIILLLSALVSEVVNLLIEHYLREHDQHGRRVYHSSRIRTLLPLLRNAFRITLGVMILMIVLAEIGVDIAPLLAAAGVVGLAVGFGAQTLVKDIITGVFILIEDTIAIGDVVDLGGHAGVVEGMTIRTIRLRDGAGAVHTVPFSAVTIVQNLTKDFSYATFDLKVDYREDIDRVIDAMKEVGASIEKDREFRYGLLGPMEIIGVDSFQDSGVFIKARMKTRAMSQWDVMRAFNIRLKRLFDERGLHFPGMMAAGAAPTPKAMDAPATPALAAPKPEEPRREEGAPTPAVSDETPAQAPVKSESKTIAPPR